MHAQRTGTNAPQTLSFDHAETLTFDQAEKRRAQAGAQLAHVPISAGQLEYQLNVWATQGGAVERRNEAKQRILGAYRTGADQLELSGLSLRTMPECIGKLTNLQTLGLGYNKLTTLPECMVKLANLQTLNLGSNKLTTLPGCIAKLANLQNLDLVSNKLTAVPENIQKLTKLQTLRLNDNQLTSLPEKIWNLPKLKTLDLGSNKLTLLSESIGDLTNLRTLRLNGNQLTTLPEGIKKLANLLLLSLDGNQVTTLPEGIKKLTNLQSLNLRSNELSALPESIKNLTKLRWLSLDGNQLTTLPEGIKKLTNLQSLNLRSNELSALPESIKNLTKLLWLSLDGNQLTTLPKRIGKLSNLQTLNLGSNKLTPLPESIWNLANLLTLNLSSNELATLPESTDKLTNLQNLFLEGNQLTTLPESISKLTDLEKLYIADNPLEYLPSALAGFQKQHKELKELPLRDPASRQANQHIAPLPESVNKLTDVKASSIRNKPLEYLPSALAEFQSPHDDELKELPLLDPAPSQTSQSILNIGPAELEALRNLKNLTLELNSMLADLKNIDSMGEQLHAVAQAQQGMVRLSALPKRLASIPQCAQFYQVALQLLLRGWAVHEALACEVIRANPRVWVLGIQTAFKAAPVPLLKMAGVAFATLVNQIDTVVQGNKGQLLLDRFNNSKVKFEQVAHTVASLCTERLESELSALPENNKDQKQIGLGKQLKALYNECEVLAQRLNLQAKPLVNPLYPAANKADELMSLLLHKLCTQDLEPGRSGAMPQAHENNFVERMSNYCVELLLPTASNTLVVGRKLLGHKAVALAPNVGSSQGRAASPPRSISPNSFARAMAEKDAAIAKLEQRLTDLQAKAEAASTLAETADRNASEAKQQISIVGLSKQSAQQVQYNLGRLVLTQSSHGTHAAQSSMSFQPGMGIGQHPNDLKTLNERVDILDHKVAELRQFDLLDTPLSALEYGRVVAAYLQEHGRLHSDGTVDLNNKQGGFKNRKLLEKLKDIHNVENRDGDYKLCIELPALLKKMSKAAYMNPRIPRNTLKLQELLDAEKTGLQKPCPKGETASGNSDINSERSQLLGLGNRF